MTATITTVGAPIPADLDHEFREWMWTRGHCWLDAVQDFMLRHGLGGGLPVVYSLPAVYDQYREFIDSCIRMAGTHEPIVDEE